MFLKPFLPWFHQRFIYGFSQTMLSGTPTRDKNKKNGIGDPTKPSLTSCLLDGCLLKNYKNR